MEQSSDTEERFAEGVVCLSTQRLWLRPLELDDAEGLFAGLGDEETMRYWSCAPKTSVREVREYIASNISTVGVQCLALTRAGGDDLAMGWVVLMDRKPGIVEIGFLLRPDACGHGYAREAVAAVVRYAFDGRQMRRITADVDPDNGASLRCLLALGFKKEGLLRENWETHIGLRDSVIFGLLARDLQ